MFYEGLVSTFSCGYACGQILGVVRMGCGLSLLGPVSWVLFADSPYKVNDRIAPLWTTALWYACTAIDSNIFVLMCNAFPVCENNIA